MRAVEEKEGDRADLYIFRKEFMWSLGTDGMHCRRFCASMASPH